MCGALRTRRRPRRAPARTDSRRCVVAALYGSRSAAATISWSSVFSRTSVLEACEVLDQDRLCRRFADHARHPRRGNLAVFRESASRRALSSAFARRSASGSVRPVLGGEHLAREALEDVLHNRVLSIHYEGRSSEIES